MARLGGDVPRCGADGQLDELDFLPKPSHGYSTKTT